MHTSHATHRLRLTLPPDSCYSISMVTSEYAMRIYVNAREMDSVGYTGQHKGNHGAQDSGAHVLLFAPRRYS